MPIIVTPTLISDVLIIQPKIIEDERGLFYESFNKKEFIEHTGVIDEFVQENHTFSNKNALRGIHYQVEYPQGKVVRVVHGKVLDISVDLRKNSPTYGKWVSVELSGENHKQVWIPPGCAHGFLVLSESALFLYKVTNYWHAASEQRIIWNDPTLKIDWQLPAGVSPLLNEKDAAGLLWDAAPKF